MRYRSKCEAIDDMPIWKRRIANEYGFNNLMHAEMETNGSEEAVLAWCEDHRRRLDMTRNFRYETPTERTEKALRRNTRTAEGTPAPTEDSSSAA